MKVFILLAMLVAVVVCEQCANQPPNYCHDHHATICGSGLHVVCGNHGQCICTNGPTGQTCTLQSDCSCSGNQGHCVDGHCHCRHH